MRAFIFLDSNIWVHFRPVQDIDWRDLLKVGHVELIVPPIVVDELDKMKDSAPSRRVQNRARGALKLIEEASIAGTSVLREGVRCRVLDSAGHLDFAGLGLDAGRSDDVLIATMDAFRRTNATERVILVSGDTGPRLKARRAKLEVVVLSSDDRIQEADPLEQEYKRLKRELQRLTSRRPNLSVKIVHGQNDGERLEVPGMVPTKVCREDHVNNALAHAHSLAPERYRQPEDVDAATTQAVSKGGLDLSQFRMPLDGITALEYERYERERQAYLSRVEAWAGEDWDRRERIARCVRIPFQLVNDGTEVAEDIDIRVHIPDGPEVYEWEEPEDVNAPAPPVQPRRLEEYLGASLFGNLSYPSMMPDLGHLRDLHLPKPPGNVSAPRIRKSQSYDVEFHVGRLKHNMQEELGELALIFPDAASSRSLTIDWQIRCGTLPDLVRGKLHLVFRT